MDDKKTVAVKPSYPMHKHMRLKIRVFVDGGNEPPDTFCCVGEATRGATVRVAEALTRLYCAGEVAHDASG